MHILNLVTLCVYVYVYIHTPKHNENVGDNHMIYILYNSHILSTFLINDSESIYIYIYIYN